MNINFKIINKENWREVVDLKISKEQERYLPHSNLISIAESKFYPNWVTLAICNDEKIIGFAMYGPDDDDEKIVWLIRYMIDERYQGNGFGHCALEKLLNEIKNKKQYDTVALSFHPESKVAKKLYTSLGFKQFITGFEAEDEVFYKLEFNK